MENTKTILTEPTTLDRLICEMIAEYNMENKDFRKKTAYADAICALNTIANIHIRQRQKCDSVEMYLGEFVYLYMKLNESDQKKVEQLLMQPDRT